MRGSIRRRSAGSWTIRFDVGVHPDGRRKQRVLTVEGTRAQAHTRLREELRRLDRGELVEPSRLTVGQWLDQWVESMIRDTRRPSTTDRYRQVIRVHLKPHLGSLLLQKLRAADFHRYYADGRSDRGLAAATLAQHHAILSSALTAAVREGLILRNVAATVAHKPRPQRTADDLRRQCWTAEEARAFLAAADATSPQASALFALALDTGARKNELCGLFWTDLDFGRATVTITRQLTSRGATPTFGPPKRNQSRVVDLALETIARLRIHRQAQAELKMRNRTTYQDHGLVFAKEWGDTYGRHDSIGNPLQSNNLGQREFARVLERAQVKRITFHGLRHTSATLLLAAGESVHVVAHRLGHASPKETLDTYAHALPPHGRNAARRLGAVLYGAGRDQSVIKTGSDGAPEPESLGDLVDWCGREDWKDDV